MNRRRIKKAILAEALRLHSESGRFPVRRFWIDHSGEVTSREYEGAFSWLNDLLHLCDQLKAAR